MVKRCCLVTFLVAGVSLAAPLWAQSTGSVSAGDSAASASDLTDEHGVPLTHKEASLPLSASDSAPWFTRSVCPPDGRGACADLCNRCGPFAYADYLNWSARRKSLDYAAVVDPTQLTNPKGSRPWPRKRSRSPEPAARAWASATVSPTAWTFPRTTLTIAPTARIRSLRPPAHLPASWRPRASSTPRPWISLKPTAVCNCRFSTPRAAGTRCSATASGSAPSAAFATRRWTSSSTTPTATPWPVRRSTARSISTRTWTPREFASAPSCSGIPGRASTSSAAGPRRCSSPPSTRNSRKATRCTARSSTCPKVLRKSYRPGGGGRPGLVPRPWELSAGYEMSNWFNMVAVNRPSENLLIDGFFLHAGWSH